MTPDQPPPKEPPTPPDRDLRAAVEDALDGLLEDGTIDRSPADPAAAVRMLARMARDGVALAARLNDDLKEEARMRGKIADAARRLADALLKRERMRAWEDGEWLDAKDLADLWAGQFSA